MTKDKPLCYTGTNKTIWTSPIRPWSREETTCYFNLDLNSLNTIQTNYNNLVLSNKIASSINNVSGLITKKQKYNYYAKGNNQLFSQQTYATQNQKNYTNPNVLSLTRKNNKLICPLI